MREGASPANRIPKLRIAEGEALVHKCRSLNGGPRPQARKSRADSRGAFPDRVLRREGLHPYWSVRPEIAFVIVVVWLRVNGDLVEEVDNPDRQRRVPCLWPA